MTHVNVNVNVNTPFDERSGTISPDSHGVSYLSSGYGQAEAQLYSYSPGTQLNAAAHVFLDRRDRALDLRVRVVEMR